LKKRTKKLLFFRSFHDRGHGRDLAASAGLKVFCFFSSEKKTLSFSGKISPKHGAMACGW
jgi:hypothetical protein